MSAKAPGVGEGGERMAGRGRVGYLGKEWTTMEPNLPNSEIKLVRDSLRWHFPGSLFNAKFGF